MLQNMFQLASLLITCLISFTLYQVIVKENTSIKAHEKILVFSCFLVPGILTPLPLLTDSYGDDGGWCWIPYKKKIDIFWIFLEFYGFLLLVLIINIWLYCKIYSNISTGQDLDRSIRHRIRILNRLKLYPIAIIICFGPSFVYRMYYICTGKYNELADIITGSLGAIYGFLNIIIYGFTKKVRTSIKNSLAKTFGKDENREKLLDHKAD